MAEIVNLNRARKQKARSVDKTRAAENRALHGRTKAEKALEEARRAQEAERLEAHRREERED
jgi:hypothetical protein